MLRLLILSRYDDLGASSRLRTLQYAPFLELIGIQVTISPLFGNTYLRSLYRSKNWFWNRVMNIFSVAKAYFRRLMIVVGAKRNFDIVWVEKELFPYLPGFAESILARIGVPYILDYDDSVFDRYDLSTSWVIRAILHRKLNVLISEASAVTAGNAYLGNYAKNNGAKNIIFTPTVVDIERYRAMPEPIGDVFRIGWIGSPSSAHYLKVIAEPLRRLAEKRNIVLVAIGAGSVNLPGVPSELHEWSIDQEAQLLESIHVGVMPLRDSPWERGKCGYKLIQYMACGRPVIASPIGVNAEIVSSDVGLLARDDNSWVDAFLELADQPMVRMQMGRAAREKVEKKYSLQVVAPRIAELIRAAASGVA